MNSGPSGFDVALECVVVLLGGIVGEAGDADVADRAVGKVLVDHLALDDRVADDGDVERLAAVAPDRQDDLGALPAADPVAGPVDRQAVQAGSVDSENLVARPEIGPFRR
jgi:hypothetical protein